MRQTMNMVLLMLAMVGEIFVFALTMYMGVDMINFAMFVITSLVMGFMVREALVMVREDQKIEEEIA